MNTPRQLTCREVGARGAFGPSVVGSLSRLSDEAATDATGPLSAITALTNPASDLVRFAAKALRQVTTREHDKPYRRAVAATRRGSTSSVLLKALRELLEPAGVRLTFGSGVQNSGGDVGADSGVLRRDAVADLMEDSAQKRGALRGSLTGTPLTSFQRLIGTLSGLLGRSARRTSMPRRSSTRSSIPIIPPQQILIPAPRTCASVSTRSCRVCVVIILP